MATYTSPVSGGSVPPCPANTKGYALFRNQHTCANGKVCYNWSVPAGQTGTATATLAGYTIMLWAFDAQGGRVESTTNSVSVTNSNTSYRFTAFFIGSAPPAGTQCTLTTNSGLVDYQCP